MTLVSEMLWGGRAAENWNAVCSCCICSTQEQDCCSTNVRGMWIVLCEIVVHWLYADAGWFQVQKHLDELSFFNFNLSLCSFLARAFEPTMCKCHRVHREALLHATHSIKWLFQHLLFTGCRTAGVSFTERKNKVISDSAPTLWTQPWMLPSPKESGGPGFKEHVEATKNLINHSGRRSILGVMF